MTSSIYRRLVEIESGDYARWNVVPNIETLATYSFRTQTIELCDFSSEDFKRALSGAVGLRKKMTVLLAHELRHWLDHVGSLWGQQMLCLGYNALNARLQNKPEEFWRIVEFRQALRDHRFERYYTTTNSVEPNNGRRRWKYQMTAGARFDHTGKMSQSHPIVFTRFDWEDGTPACRVPVSVASLLETSAMHFELRAEESFVALLDAKERSAASEALQTKYLDTMYDPELAEYSVAVHAVSNFVGPKDCPVAFELSSILASIALNLTKEHFDQLRVPESFDLWRERNDAFKVNMDRGYAFLVLASTAPHVPIENIDEWITETLASAGLPDIDKIETDASRAMKELRRDLVDGPLSDVRDKQLDLGVKMFSKFGPIFRFDNTFANFDRWAAIGPPIVLGQDLSIAANGEVRDWDESPIGSQIDTLLATFDKCTEFAEACGI